MASSSPWSTSLFYRSEHMSRGASVAGRTRPSALKEGFSTGYQGSSDFVQRVIGWSFT